MIKKVLITAFFAAIIAIVTFPYWGSCGLKYDTCVLSCELRQRHDGIAKAACRAECYARKVACISSQALNR